MRSRTIRRICRVPLLKLSFSPSQKGEMTEVASKNTRDTRAVARASLPAHMSRLAGSECTRFRCSWESIYGMWKWFTQLATHVSPSEYFCRALREYKGKKESERDGKRSFPCGYFPLAVLGNCILPNKSKGVIDSATVYDLLFIYK